jgi:hypothetical protein
MGHRSTLPQDGKERKRGRPLWCPVSAISECSSPEAVLWDELSNVSGLRFLDR